MFFPMQNYKLSNLLASVCEAYVAYLYILIIIYLPNNVGHQNVDLIAATC